MSGSRRWSEFPSRFKENLDSTSAIAGIGGAGLGAAGWGVLPPPFTLIAVGVGGVITVSALGYSAFKAIPPKLVDASEMVGRTIPLSELERISEKLPIIAIIGPSKAGKTTLRNRLSFIRKTTERTNNVTAQIVALPIAPTRYVAVLDGGGHVYQQQFTLAELCDHLCIVLDHNPSDISIEPEDERIIRHREFLEQVSNSIREYREAKLTSLFFLWNKRDLWEQADSDSLMKFTEFKEETIKDWRQANFASELGESMHSNELPDDVAQVVERLIEITDSAGGQL